jgi:tetratricopeptide (TPR) repeat protein
VKRLVPLLLILAIVVTVPIALHAQAPRRFKNLKVFPKDTPRDSLLHAMHGYTDALGVRCQYCHVTRKGSTGRDSLDFASDEKKMKDKARFMIRMVRDLNSRTLAKLPDRSRPPVPVSCVTCHRGSALPKTIDMVVAAAIDSGGVEVGVRRYRQLREGTMEQGRFDFSEAPVNELAHSLAARGRVPEAIALLEMNAEFHPKSADIDVEFGDIYREHREREKAVEHYRKALEKEPDHPVARRRLDELTGEKSHP